MANIYINTMPFTATNAAGALNPSYKVGDICLMQDHISLPSLTGIGNPLTRQNIDKIGVRFLPTSDAYDAELRRTFRIAARDMNFPSHSLREGIYCFVSQVCRPMRRAAKHDSSHGRWRRCRYVDRA